MVAANEPQKPKGKPGPKKGLSRHSKQINPAQEAIVRTRYLVHGDCPAAISKDYKIPLGPIHNLVSRRGWASMRAELWAKRTAETEAAMKSDVDRVMQTIAFDAEELSSASADMARTAVKSKDAKALSMTSSAMRNFVDIARRTRGLDQQQAGLIGGNVNFFVLQGIPQADRSIREAVNVTPSSSSTVQIEANAIV